MFNVFPFEDSFLLGIGLGNEDVNHSQNLLECEVQKAYAVNLAVDRFLRGEIDEETFLDVVEANDQDMDNYIFIVNENLESYIKQ